MLPKHSTTLLLPGVAGKRVSHIFHRVMLVLKTHLLLKNGLLTISSLSYSHYLTWIHTQNSFLSISEAKAKLVSVRQSSSHTHLLDTPPSKPSWRHTILINYLLELDLCLQWLALSHHSK